LADRFGFQQKLPLTADAFKNLQWSVNVSENGAITTAKFASKASGVTASSLFGTVASDASAVAAAQRTVASTKASAVQGQPDLIYQTQRSELCQAQPTGCPSK
jgi:hypothetical protein